MLIIHDQVLQTLSSSPCLPANVSTTISLTHNRTLQKSDKMAEEAMRSLGDKFFYFDENGDHIPFQRAYETVPDEEAFEREHYGWYYEYFENLSRAPAAAAPATASATVPTTAPQQAPTISPSQPLLQPLSLAAAVLPAKSPSVSVL
jgi:hypothetical protein